MKVEGGYLIGRIKLLSGRILNKLLLENKLNEFNGEQGKILFHLWKEDGLSSSSLAKKSGLALNSLTIMLDRMEESDLVSRKVCCKDKRKKLVYLTDKGKNLENKTNEVNDLMNKIFYKDFKEEEIIQFETYLNKIMNNLREVDDD